MDQSIAVLSTLSGVIVGFVLAELSQARTRARETEDAWFRLDHEVRGAILMLELAVENRAARYAVSPPIELTSLETSSVALGRVVDMRILRGFMNFVSWFRFAAEPELKTLDKDIDDDGADHITAGIDLLKDLLQALYFDRELRRRRHRLWPWSESARAMRTGIETVLTDHKLEAKVGEFRED